MVARIRLRDAPLLLYSANHGNIRVHSSERSVPYRTPSRSTRLQSHVLFHGLDTSSWHVVTFVEFFERVVESPGVPPQLEVRKCHLGIWPGILGFAVHPGAPAGHCSDGDRQRESPPSGFARVFGVGDLPKPRYV